MKMEQPCTILIVDDVPANIDTLTDMLESGGYNEPISATNGNEALELIKKNQVDLILLDVMMPEMDGFEVCRRIKSNPKTSEIPVLFVTAKDQAEDQAKGFDFGGVDYITKPISTPVVLARVKTHLALRSAYQKLEKQNEALRKAERLREDMEALIRHDLKSPINSILGTIEFLLLRDCAEDQREYLELMHGGSLRLLDMVNLSMDLIKMERGGYNPKLKNIDLLTIIQQIMKGLQEKMNMDSLKILINGRDVEAKSRFFVRGEETLCHSTLTNLIKNAVEASPDEPVTISLRDNDDTIAVIEIHNHGVVPSEIRDRFFEKYVTSGKMAGTGLGTYSAKLMTHAQKGSIHLETSDEKKTTTVTIKLQKGTKNENSDR